MAMTKTRRRKSANRSSEKGMTAERLQAFLWNRLTNPDPRSHAEFLHDTRTKQAAGQLANPATAALLDRLERAI